MLAVCTSSLKLDGIAKGMIDDNCVLDFFNHTTHLFNGPWNCSNHAGTCGHFNQVVFVVIYSPCYFNASKPNYWLPMCTLMEQWSMQCISHSKLYTVPALMRASFQTHVIIMSQLIIYAENVSCEGVTVIALSQPVTGILKISVWESL